MNCPRPWNSLFFVICYSLLLFSGALTFSWQRPWPVLPALAAGYGLSLVVAGYGVREFLQITRLALSGDPPSDSARCKWIGEYAGGVTGFIERLVFTTLVFADLKAALIGMGGWLTLKMAATWNRDISTGSIPNPFNPRNEKLLWASHAFLSLQAGLVSMAFAGAGGALALWLMYLPVG